MSLSTPITYLLVVTLLLGGCNLTIDVDAHPYHDDGPGADAGQDIGDADPALGPRLLITELMLRPDATPDSGARLGQYIELFNAGDQPIHPAALVLEVLETNERIVVDINVAAAEAIEPIEAGEYFLFLRRDDPHYAITDHLREGSYYEWAQWGSTVALSPTRQTVRLLEMKSEFEFRIHDQVGWRKGELVDLGQSSSATLVIPENVGLGLNAEIDDFDGAADPENWCLHVERFGDGPLYGSPGQPSPDRCL